MGDLLEEAIAAPFAQPEMPMRFAPGLARVLDEPILREADDHHVAFFLLDQLGPIRAFPDADDPRGLAIESMARAVTGLTAA